MLDLSSLPLYMVLAAVWLTLVGVVINDASVKVKLPVALGAATALVMVATGLAWLAAPVVVLWLVGVVLLSREQKRSG
ncbi:hypothetical protein GCM10022247_05630 [Allokutzneria multivorans]|uniref:Uncharacterized protein n=1 Tax=Allokutzneria multivorans TaxID=1142134 RepID=A0ABP7QZ27_9PSEU